MHQKRNVVAMLFQCLASIADSDTALNQKISQESRNLKFQSICHNKNNPTIFKMVTKKRTKRSPNIIVT